VINSLLSETIRILELEKRLNHVRKSVLNKAC